MGFMDQFRQAQTEGIPDSWQFLAEADQLTQLLEHSYHKPQVIFKHSTRCGISSMAKHMLEQDWDFSQEDLDMYFLDLIAHRAISNAVADQLGVVHQSPQLIVVYQGKAVFDTSHHAISGGRLRAALNSL